MSKKKYTAEEFGEIIQAALQGYTNWLQAGKMTFTEFVIFENVLLKIEEALKDLESSDYKLEQEDD